jgi:outer membrane immunogenic protein
MKKFWLGSLGLLASMAGGSALAADLGSPVYKAPPPIAAPVYNWSGLYIGVNAGGSWGNSDVTFNQPITLPGAPFAEPCFGVIVACVVNGSGNGSGFLGGGQVGYNWQTGNFVFGLEADIDWRRLDTSGATVLNVFNDTLTLTDDQRWLGTGRGRLGWAVNNWLFYATGGLAYGNVQHEVSECGNCGGSIGGPQSLLVVSDSATKTGWTAGAGVEWGFAPNWSLGVEYLYVDLGHDTVSIAQTTVGTLTHPASTTDFDDRSNIVRARLNYKFDWGAPVVSRY